MKKILLIIPIIFAMNLSALDLYNILIEWSDNKSYKQSCLNLSYSNEFCDFSGTVAMLLF